MRKRERDRERERERERERKRERVRERERESYHVITKEEEVIENIIKKRMRRKDRHIMM